MAKIPAKPTKAWAKKALQEWYTAAEELKTMRAREILLRKALVDFYFPEAEEGTNRTTMDDDFVLECQQPFNYKVDEAELDILIAELKANDDKGNKRDMDLPHSVVLSADKLLRYKPELNKRAYNTLTEGEQMVFDRALEISPGTPSLKIKPPKGK